MKFRVIGIVLLTFMIFPTEELAAQLKGISKGDSVRIWAPSAYDHQMIGQVLDISSDSIRISYAFHNPPWRVLSLSSISKMEVRRSRIQTGRGAMIGSITGAVGLGFLAMAGNESSTDEGEWGFIEFSSTELFLGGAVIGALSGAFVGAIIGSTMKREEWRKVRFEVDTIAINTTQFDRDRIPGIKIKWSL